MPLASHSASLPLPANPRSTGPLAREVAEAAAVPAPAWEEAG